VSKYQYQVIINTPEGGTHEHSDVIEANTYQEAILRGLAQTFEEIAQFRRNNNMDKLVTLDINVFAKKVSSD